MINLILFSILFNLGLQDFESHISSKDLYESKIPAPTDLSLPGDTCLNVKGIISNCQTLWIKVNIHLYVNDQCEGKLAMSSGVTYDTNLENAYSIAEDIINKSNLFAENISDNKPFQNESIKLPPVAQCYPMRFLLKDVHVHCDNQRLTDKHNWNNQVVNQNDEINVFVTKITNGPNGWTNFKGDYLVSNGLTGAIIPHEVLHIGNVHHTWEEYGIYQLEDTWQNNVDWDHDCNPDTPNFKGAINCWSTADSSKCPMISCPLNIKHPCCDWGHQTSNLMSGSAWAENGTYATVTHDQIERALTTFNQLFCQKIAAIDPECPPSSSVIGILPAENLQDDTSYSINFEASMNEVEYKYEFFLDGLDEQKLVYSCNWKNGKAKSYCVNLKSKWYAKPGNYEDGFKAGYTYNVKLLTKDACGNIAESTKSFTLPPLKD